MSEKIIDARKGYLFKIRILHASVLTYYGDCVDDYHNWVVYYSKQVTFYGSFISFFDCYDGTFVSASGSILVQDERDPDAEQVE